MQDFITYFENWNRLPIYLPFDPNKNAINYVDDAVSKSMNKLCLTRKMFVVDPLGQGQLARYDLNRGLKYIYAGDNVIREVRANPSEHVDIPEFDISFSNTVSMQDTYAKLYNHVITLFRKLADEEERVAFELIAKVIDLTENIEVYEEDYFRENISSIMEKNYKKAGTMALHIFNPKDIIKFYKSLCNYNYFTTADSCEWWKGAVGRLVGNGLVFVSGNIPRNKCYMIGYPEYFGVLAERTEPFVELKDNDNHAFCMERIGMLIADTSNVKCIGWE